MCVVDLFLSCNLPQSNICSDFVSPYLCRLGLAYAGSNREDVLSMLYPVLSHPKSTMEVCRTNYPLKLQKFLGQLIFP